MPTEGRCAVPEAPAPVAALGAAPDSETARFLCDLAVKRHDLAERSYDALNTRLAAVFAFNSFLLPASIAALRTVTQTGRVLRGWACWIAVAVWATSLVVVTVATITGLRARPIDTLPDPFKLDRDFANQPPVAAARQVIRSLDRAWSAITAATGTKSTCFNVAISAVVVELVVLVVLSALELVR